MRTDDAESTVPIADIGSDSVVDGVVRVSVIQEGRDCWNAISLSHRPVG